jgi:hypothetical protein
MGERRWTVVIFTQDDCNDLSRCPGIPAIACGSLEEAQRIFAALPEGFAPHILSTIPAAEFAGGVRDDLPEVVEMTAEQEAAYWRNHAQNGVDTPGCDCGHEEMGRAWHAGDCAWKVGLKP